MKKIIIAIAFTVGSVATSFAEKSSTDSAAMNIFKVLINSAGNTAWQKKVHYTERSFLYKGQEISAYYKSGRLMGLSCMLVDANDLPKEILNEIRKKYQRYEVAHVLIFMDNSGHSSYYAGLRNKNIYTALKISETCKLHVIKRLHLK